MSQPLLTCVHCGQAAVYSLPHETLCVNCGDYFDDGNSPFAAPQETP